MIDALANDLTQADTPLYALKLLAKPASYDQAATEVDKDITQNIAGRLISLTVTDNRGFEADTLTLTLDDADGNIAMPARSAVVGVSLGRQGENPTDMGSFTIDQVTHRGTPDQLVISGRSVDFREGMNTAKEGSWHDTTLGAIVENIATRNKLKASVAAELAGIKIAHIDQSKESDIGFLTRLAIRNGAEIAVKKGTLIFLVPGKCVRNGKAVTPVTISRGDGDTHTFDLADRAAYGGVVAHWQDTKTPQKQTKQVEMKRKEESKQEATNYTAGSAENVYILPTLYASKDEATRAADAAWKELQRTAAKFTLVLAQGRGDIAPETPIRLSGFKDVINNTPWVIKKVTHALDNKGFITKLELEIDVSKVAYEFKTQE